MSSNIPRRQFLKGSIQAGLVLGGLATLGGSVEAAEPVKRAGKPHFRLSMCAYSFRQYFSDKADPAKRIDMFQFVDYCADHGCDGAELTSYYFPKDADDEYLAKLRRHMYLRGLSASGTSVGNDFTLPEGPKRDEQIALAKKWIDRASFLGAPYVRLFAGMDKVKDEKEATKLCVSAMQECCEYAGKKGIMIGMENHHGIVSTPDQILHIIDAVGSEWFGINCDTANFHTEDPYADLEKIAPYAINVHFKGEIHPTGHKDSVPADLPRLMKILRDAKYQGYLALEYESKEDPWTGVPKLLDGMKQLM